MERKLMNRADGGGRAGLLVGGLMALAGFGLVGCEADNSDYEGGMPVGGSSASLGLAPDGRCAEVYTHVERFREDGSLWATVDIHRDGAGLGGTVQLDGEAEAWTISGWEREARLSPDGEVRDYVYVAQMELLDGAGAVQAKAYLFSRHEEGKPEKLNAFTINVAPPDAEGRGEAYCGERCPEISLRVGDIESTNFYQATSPSCL